MRHLKQWTAALLAAALTLTLTAPAFAAGGTAYASTQNVEVDGKKIEFQMYALKDANGNSTNYVKLRDVAHVLNGTSSQFSVGYDSASQAISVTSGQAYTDLGSEMYTPFSGNRSYSAAANPVLVNGKAASLDAISLTDDNGGGYTYFKLRDLGAALGFTVDWSAQRGVYIETGTASQPETPVTPAGTKDIAVTTKETQYGTGYYVTDNGFGDGCLNNGKPITEENVLELLEEAQRIWPEGTSWCPRATYNNHWYQSSGDIVDALLHSNGYNVSSNFACGGLSAMLSDYVFGQNSNPFHRVYDPMDIRAGDVIILKNADGTVDHVSFAATSTIQSGDYAGRLWTVDGGGTNGKITWPDYQYSFPTSEAFQSQLLQSQSRPVFTWEVWSRYPE